MQTLVEIISGHLASLYVPPSPGSELTANCTASESSTALYSTSADVKLKYP